MAGPPNLTAAAVACVVGISFAPILVRWADAAPLAVAFWRNALGFAVVALLARAKRGHSTQHGGERLPGWAAVVAGALLAAHFAAWTSSLDHTTVANSVVIIAMQPALVTVASWVVNAERPPELAWVAVALAIVGVVVVGGADLGGAGDRLYGNALAAAGAVAGGLYFVAGRRARSRVGSTPAADQAVDFFSYLTVLYGVAAAGLLILCLATATPLWLDAEAFAWVVALTVAGQFLGHTILNLLLGYLPAWGVAITAVGEAVGATALAWALLDEAPTRGAWLGGPLVLAAVVLALYVTARPPSAESLDRA